MLPETFRQECAFGDFRSVGEVRVFRMVSGRLVAAKLTEIDSADYQWSADDTGQRDLIWQILDEMETAERSMIDHTVTIVMKSGKIVSVKTQDYLETVGAIERRPITLEEIVARKLKVNLDRTAGDFK